jgi:hypothetical protein
MHDWTVCAPAVVVMPLDPGAGAGAAGGRSTGFQANVTGVDTEAFVTGRPAQTSRWVRDFSCTPLPGQKKHGTQPNVALFRFPPGRP